MKRWFSTLRAALRRPALASFGALAALLVAVPAAHAQAAKKPNILVIWGDDIGISNLS